jgi:fatty-acyl-CoA synthase
MNEGTYEIGDSYARGSSSQPLLEETIGQNLTATVARFGGRDALVEYSTGRRWTYDEFEADVDVVALGLLALGIVKGDRVGIWAPNCAEWALVQYATAKLGAILVNINPAYRTHELAFVAKQSGIRTLVAIPEFKGSSYADMIESVRDEVPALKDVILIGTESWAKLMDVGSRGDRHQLAEIGATLRASDPINLQYTSGTTGFPKGATLSHRNILNNGFMIGELVHYTEQDRICIPVPFYHCFGMVMGNLAATSHGAAMIIPAPSFDPAVTLEAVAAERCTSLYGVPTMFIAMLNDPTLDTRDLSSLRTGIMAGSPCPAETMKQVIERLGMSEICICYGMTETSPVSMQTRRDDSFDVRVSTVGSVHPHLEIKMVDPLTGAVVPRGKIGEFCSRGYSIMLGYWDQPEKTAETIDEHGWLHTGDLASMDAAGNVSITGRIKDLVLRGGENIYPREIEEFLLTHPDILDVQVIGVPDPKYGEELMAWVRMKPDATALDVAAVKQFSAGRLAHYKIPRYVHLVEEFPMTVTGKVRKIEMREMAVELLGL